MLFPQKPRELRGQKPVDKDSDEYWTVDGKVLSEAQRAVCLHAMDEKNLVTVLTGEAGTGKSLVIHWLRENYACTVTATTAKAAVQLGGRTIDAITAMKRGENECTCFSEGYLRRIMEEVEGLIILDEASMMGAKMADYIQSVLEDFNLRILLVGDWAQASPVKDGWVDLDKCAMFAAGRAVWFNLIDCYRQDDPDYLAALNDIRTGVASDQAVKLFSGRIGDPPDGDLYLRMMATNNKVSGYNRERFLAHCRENNQNSAVMKASLMDMRSDYKRKDKPWNGRKKSQFIENSRLADGVPVAVGARVMVTMNTGSTVNGDTGTVVAVHTDQGPLQDVEVCPFNDPDPVVKSVTVEIDRLADVYDNLEKTPITDRDTFTQVKFLPGTKKIENALGEIEAAVTGFPLTLGYAVTIHKSQGMTVHRAWVDLPSILHMKGDSKHGLAYVALSRTRTLDGLLISGWDDGVVYCSEKAKPLIAPDKDRLAVS